MGAPYTSLHYAISMAHRAKANEERPYDFAGPTAHSQVHVRVKSHSQSQFLTLHTGSGRVLPRSFRYGLW